MTAEQGDPAKKNENGPRRRSLRELAFRWPRTTAAICFATLALIFVVLTAREAFQLHDLAVDRRHRELEYRALVIQDNLTAGLRTLSFMRATAEHFLERRPSDAEFAAQPALQDASRLREQRTWSIEVERNSPPIQGVQSEVLAGLPGFQRREDSFPADLLLGALMSRALGQSVAEHPFAARMVFVSSNGFFVSYPMVPDERIEELLKIAAFRPYFQGALRRVAGANPYVLPSSPMREAQVGRQVLAFSTPVRVHGTFRGAMVLIAHKVYLDRLLQSASVSSRGALLLNKRGEVIAARDSDSPVDAGTFSILYPIARSGPSQPQYGALTWPDHGKILYRWVNEDWLLAQPVSYWELYGPTLLRLTPLAITLLVVGAVLFLTTFRLAMLLMRHQIEAQAQSRELAFRDPLTGLGNRRFLHEHFSQLAEDCQRRNLPLALAVFDVDHFKRINDAWGHASGDAVLKTLANTALRVVRTSDAVVRLGGEEFALLLPGATAEQALASAERLRIALAAARCAPVGKDGSRLTQAEPLRFTASFGVAEAQADRSFDLDALMAIADERLYRAKQRGRNCVVDHT
ncbi:diguanylate cyclase [Niveibacterium sp. SC-1]|uniref:diguanylate cyclase n=1 Tax=Niveibacterium sp. SC-1 TaxID=3135646 RepID=UPI00311EEA8A